MRIQALRYPVACAFLLGSTLGCSGTDEPTDRTAWLISRAQEVRELSLLKSVPIVSTTKEAFLASVAADADAIDDAELTELQDTYGRLGFFDAELDLHEVYGGTSGWVAATYSASKETITLIGSPSEDVVVHELVHALQDQHFDLEVYEDTLTSDAFMARAAVVEGDAELAQVRFYFQEAYGVDLNRLDFEALFAQVRDSSEAYLDESPYPPVFSAYPSFVYSYGLAFCVNNLTGATPASPAASLAFPYDWARQDTLFSLNTPATARQIVALDKAADTAPGLDAVPADLASSLDTIDWDTLGTWYTYLLFRTALGAEPALDLAKTERGDRALFVKDSATGAVGATWTSRWQDDTAASNAETALVTLQGLTLNDSEPREAQTTDGEFAWLERRGDTLVFLKNVPAGSAPDLAEALFASPNAKVVPAPRARKPLAERIRRLTRTL